MCDDSALHRFNTEEEINQMVTDISSAQRELSLVCVIGAGVSISQGYPDWNHYVLELIDYWRFHLDVIVDRDDTERKEVNREDLVFLEWLRNANYTNKRKVDLVNYVVEQYSEAVSHDKLESKNIYSEVVNECEHYIFLKLPPIQGRNQILEQLVRMHTTFVTTNYDQQIEDSITRQLAQKPVRYADITEMPTSFQIDSIIHIHGMPIKNVRMFVSSSTSYSDLYFGHTELRQKFQKFFSNKKKIVFLFIGCSMEEEEVLSLLEIPGVQLVKYALMKYNSSENSAADRFQNQKIADFYWAKRSVKFIWFGDKFSALPTFIETLVKRVDANQISGTLQSEDLTWIIHLGIWDMKSHLAGLKATFGALRILTERRSW
ncbi:SIR2 family protein [Lacticaseibacillus sp. N501-2]|uniref:SIR2 family protein n=1 Tax=Lacticaseibacillus salsurae TaxID=3367729 RepID=UPI0038B36FCD